VAVLDEQLTAELREDVGRGCFVCGKPVQPPAVAWVGGIDQVLVLDAACAAYLGPELTADAREAVLAGDPRPHWRARAEAIAHRRAATPVTDHARDQERKR
jgi:hypothetical protein